MESSQQVVPHPTTTPLQTSASYHRTPNGILLESWINHNIINNFPSSSSSFFYITNARGDVVQRYTLHTNDLFGGLIHNYHYDAFGNELNSELSEELYYETHQRYNSNPFRFAGEYFDSETGTYYLRARHFNPRIGRFTQADPYWDITNMMDCSWSIVQSGNLFVYTSNNPVRFVDSSGLKQRDVISPFRDLGGSGPGSSGASWGSARGARGGSTRPALAQPSGAAVVGGGIAGFSGYTAVAHAFGIATVGVIAAVTFDNISHYMQDTTRTRNFVMSQINNNLSPQGFSDHIVYVLFDHTRSEVFYVGRTQHFSARSSAHKNDIRFASRDFDMFPIIGNLTRNEARAWEQTIITAFTLEALSNKINSIAHGNLANFHAEFQRVLTLLKIH